MLLIEAFKKIVLIVYMKEKKCTYLYMEIYQIIALSLV